MKWSKNTGGLTQVKAICFLHTYRYIMAARKSTLQNIVSGFGVRSEHRIDILNAKSVENEQLNVFLTAIYRKDCFFLGSRKEVQKEPPEVFYKKSYT